MKHPSIGVLNHTRTRVSKTALLRVVRHLFNDFRSHKKIKTLQKQKKQDGVCDLTIVFLGARAAKILNSRYRGRTYATDVLSFEGSNDGLGEIVICLPVVKRQSVEHGVSFKEELVYLVIHGFLHLLGYDHEKSRSAEGRMMKLQDALFEKLTSQK